MDFIRDQSSGPQTIDFSTLTEKELRERFWSFPEARELYIKQFLAKRGIRAK